MKRLIRQPEISNIMLCSYSDRDAIMAAISAKDVTKNMVRVKSSNVWSYAININKYGDKFGDVYVQFKGRDGGPGDIYVYYDVPIKVYNAWVKAPSKGHYFWQYIRNNFQTAKLTGDKRMKIKNSKTP